MGSGSPALARRALARCVADAEAFPAAWGRRPLLSTASELGGGFEDLLDLAAVDELIARRGLRTPFLRLVKDGEIVPTAAFTAGGGAGAEIADQVDETAVARLFADGATIVLQGLHRTWSPIADFATELRGELGHPVQVNAYVTPPASRGFGTHYDVHDVFVLQFAGEKRWLVHEPVLEAPLRSQPWTQRRERVERASAAPPVLDVTLRPGDALYLPRGWLHAAEALGATSGHLTVGIHVVTRRALADALLALADDEPELRQALPVGVDLGDAEALRGEVEATVAALCRRLEQGDDAAAVADRLAARLLGPARPASLSPLRQADAVASVGSETVVRPRGGVVSLGVETRGGAVVLRLPGRELDLGEADPRAVEVLLEGGARAVGELPGPAGAAAELVVRLLREGVVVPDAP